MTKCSLLQRPKHHNLEIPTCDPFKYKVDNPILIVFISIRKSIRIQRVKDRLYASRKCTKISWAGSNVFFFFACCMVYYWHLLWQRTCNGFVLQCAYFYSKKSIGNKSPKIITKWYPRVSSLMSLIYFCQLNAFLWLILGLNTCPIKHDRTYKTTFHISLHIILHLKM